MIGGFSFSRMHAAMGVLVFERLSLLFYFLLSCFSFFPPFPSSYLPFLLDLLFGCSWLLACAAKSELRDACVHGFRPAVVSLVANLSSRAVTPWVYSSSLSQLYFRFIFLYLCLALSTGGYHVHAFS